MSELRRIQFVDSHTGGEPTRVILAGGPDLGFGTLEERRRRFAEQDDELRSVMVNEPRGSDIVVGAILVEPTDSGCVAGVIFFNNVGYLGMCGHGTIGIAVTLGHLGRIGAGRHCLETPVGIVSFDYDGHNTVSVANVPSYRFAKRVAVSVPGHGVVHGDIAWGGNWFFLVDDHGETIDRANIERLTTLTASIKQALLDQNIRGKDGAEIDHIELFGPPGAPENHSRNFVLCPGNAYDRSPCGTGLSAKLACLVAEGKLEPGEIWRQESVIGSVFEGSVRIVDGVIHPTVRGTAYVTAEGNLLIDPNDALLEVLQA